MPLEFGDMTLYTVDDLAGMLSVSVTTVRSYIRSGKLKGRKMGRRWYVPDESVQQYFRELEAQGQIVIRQDDTPEVLVNLEEPDPEPPEPPRPMPSPPSTPMGQPGPRQPDKSAPPPAPIPAPANQAPQPPGEWSDEVRDLLEKAERLKREARRVEQLYVDSDGDSPTQAG